MVKFMKSCFSVFLMILMTTIVSAQDNGIEKSGLYVMASDLGKAREFYEKLFQKPPYVTNARLVGFDIAGGLYAIFAAQSSDQVLVKGNSTIPYIRVTDAEPEFARVKLLGANMIDSKVLQEGPIKLFRFADPDGNVIEFFSLVVGVAK
jgi:predicted enzyme related to lactoylglutathione lyase